MGKTPAKELHDAIWDLVEELWYGGRVPEDSRRRAGRAVRGFRQRLGDDTEPAEAVIEIRRRHKIYCARLKKHWNDEIFDSAEGLLKWWWQLAGNSPDDFDAELRKARE
jgi:hypothetical protein